MAWFKSNNAVDEPTPVTPERLEAALARQELKVQRDEGGAPRYYCFINNLPFMFIAAFETSVVVSASTFGRLPVEREDEVLEWAKASNAGTHYITAVMNSDDEGVFLNTDCAIFTGAGLTDIQLDKQLELMIVGALTVMENYCSEFGIPVGEES
ncbi:YbjN domain-containing protein [Corynebacterium sp. CCM 9185]|uniref:YbjN domain-containing protein n=1 Tax=Corynebacterium marambiense TaxID=2765364 RepID=A0ABS0VRL8_9CORY|nr:YbjN domain-containing protein [Corynebacterium marambiense]MBI8999416.1 YbjN domain-containing protein [Corynebacterium marambiense]MCK7662254.1 YbjN domain-containing protein [Corynebacterium marambiense]MCX7541522.1 YbjN domain-containing protein [Corynebacterium marambiense]